MRPSPSCCALTSYWTRRNSRIRKPGISLTAMSNHRTEGEGRMIGDNRHSHNLSVGGDLRLSRRIREMSATPAETGATTRST